MNSGAVAVLAEKDAEIGQLKAEKRFGSLDCQLGVMATATNSAIQALQNTVNHITNTVIPISAICPEPMPRYTAEAPNTQPVTVQSRTKA